MIKGILNGLARFTGSVLSITLASTGYLSINGKRIYFLTGDVTTNVTPTAAPAGSFALTTSNVGKLLIFYSDGAKWQTYTGA